MSKDPITLEDTPIFTQLAQEYAAREKFAEHFEENDDPDA
jgi:hypothetical protein